MTEFSAGLQTRQEERYRFWLFLGGGGCAYSGLCAYSREYGMWIITEICRVSTTQYYTGAIHNCFSS